MYSYRAQQSTHIFKYIKFTQHTGSSYTRITVFQLPLSSEDINVLRNNCTNITKFNRTKRRL